MDLRQLGHRFRRMGIVAKILIGVALLVILGTVAVSIYLNSLVNRRLKEMVYESSDGLYRLEYSRISINALTGNLTVYGAELIADSAAFVRLGQQRKAPRFLVAGKTQRLSVKNVRWLVYLTSKKLTIGKLLINKPQFRLTQYRLRKDTVNRPSGISDFMSKHVKDLKLGQFTITDAVINYEIADTAANTRTIDKIEHLDLSFSKVHFDAGEHNSRVSADDYNISLKEYKHRSTDSLYWIGISGFKYQSKNKKAELHAFYVRPGYKEKDFYKRINHQQTRYEILLNNIRAEGLDITNFADEGVAIVEKLLVGGGSIKMYMDRSLPTPPAKRNVVPSQKIMQIEFPFAINKMIFNKLDVSYSEFNPATRQVAVIPFVDLTGEASNITNLPNLAKKNALMKLDLKASFMKAGVNANMEFDLTSPDGHFTSRLVINQLEADKLNPILMPIAKIEARQGLLKQLDATVRGNQDGSIANVNMLYDDLKINVLKMEGDSLKKKGLKTMFANLFIEDDNPKNGILRTASGLVKRRKPGRSFFSLLWASIAAGMQQIITDKRDIQF